MSERRLTTSLHSARSHKRMGAKWCQCWRLQAAVIQMVHLSYGIFQFLVVDRHFIDFIYFVHYDSILEYYQRL